MIRTEMQRHATPDRNRQDGRRPNSVAAPVRLAGILAGLLGAGLLAACQQNATPALLPAQSATASALAANPAAPFQAGLSPAAPLPVPLGKPLKFQLTASQPGHAHLYLVSASGKVTALAENLPVGPGQIRTYPESNAGFSLTATPPTGTDRAILLVTTQPFAGLANSQGRPTSTPVPLNLSGAEFMDRFNATTAALPSYAWAASELPVPIVAR